MKFSKSHSELSIELVFKANTPSEMDRAKWKAMKNLARKWFQKLCTFLLKVIFKFGKIWTLCVSWLRSKQRRARCLIRLICIRILNIYLRIFQKWFGCPETKINSTEITKWVDNDMTLYNHCSLLFLKNRSFSDWKVKIHTFKALG